MCFRNSLKSKGHNGALNLIIWAVKINVSTLEASLPTNQEHKFCLIIEEYVRVIIAIDQNYFQVAGANEISKFFVGHPIWLEFFPDLPCILSSIDVPCLLVQILDICPWKRTTEDGEVIVDSYSSRSF